MPVMDTVCQRVGARVQGAGCTEGLGCRVRGALKG